MIHAPTSNGVTYVDDGAARPWPVPAIIFSLFGLMAAGIGFAVWTDGGTINRLANTFWAVVAVVLSGVVVSGIAQFHIHNSRSEE